MYVAACEHILHSLHTPRGPKPSWHKHCPGTSQNPPTSAEKNKTNKNIKPITQQLLSSQSLYCGGAWYISVWENAYRDPIIPSLYYKHSTHSIQLPVCTDHTRLLSSLHCTDTEMEQYSSLQLDDNLPYISLEGNRQYFQYTLYTSILLFWWNHWFTSMWANCISQTFISYEHSSMFGQMFTDDYESICERVF